MGNILVVIGLLIVVYTVIAMISGLPQVSDFLPVGFFGNVSTKDSFYKIVATKSDGKGPWVVSAVGGMLICAGLIINYFCK